jgi:hypothetical protein
MKVRKLLVEMETWNVVKSFDVNLRRASSLCRIQSARAADHSTALMLPEELETMLGFSKNIFAKFVGEKWDDFSSKYC